MSEKTVATREQIDAFVEENWDDFLKDLQSLVAIDSVEDMTTAGPGAPFGQNPKAAMQQALTIAHRMGFATKDDEGYVGIADYAPKTKKGEAADNGCVTDPDKTIAIMGHVDIVPVGVGWESDPFTVSEKEGFLFGRGVSDDKGPFLASLYAGKYFIDNNIDLPYLLRYIVGSNEETSLGDAEYYTEHYPQPDFLLTPDAAFPVSAGEKGIFSGRFIARGIAGGTLEKIEAGSATNVIPKVSVATVKANIEELPACENIALEEAGDGRVTITATGIPGHAALPEKAKNPSRLLFDYLYENNLFDENQKAFVELGRVIQSSYRGEPLGIDATDDVFEPLSVVGGLILQDGNDLVQDVNIRYPKSTNGEKIAAQLNNVAEKYGLEFVVDDDFPTYYVGADSDPIQTLYATFKDFFNEDVKIGTIAGGTYARHFERAAAFGPKVPWRSFPSFVGDEHSTNEGIPKDLLKRVMGIYIDAIQRLMQLTY